METLSLSQKQIIYGGLLGDAYYNRKRNFIRFTHCEKQYDYLIWKRKHFDNDDLYSIQKRVYPQGYVGYSFEFVNKKSKYQEFFNYLNKNLFTNERKKISLQYLNKLDSLGLAVWWLDDGSLSTHKGNRWGKLSTNSLNYEEHILLQKYFHDKWNIDVQIKMEKEKYYFLRFNVKALKQLFSIICYHVAEIPCMLYKIDLDYKRETNLGEYADTYYFIKEQINRFVNGTLETTGDVW